LLLGCVQRVFYPQVHRATIHALAAEGYEVIAPAMPECCGALEFHSGEEPAAVKRARATIAAFSAAGGSEGFDQIVVNANMVAHMPAAMATFLGVRAKKPFFITGFP